MKENDPRVDDTNDGRPGVMGGECARCFHVPPLHEHGCATLELRTCPYCNHDWSDHLIANGKISGCP